MTPDSILYLTFVIAVFAQFAVVLAYAEWATRHANDNRTKPAEMGRQKPANNEDARLILNKAA